MDLIIELISLGRNAREEAKIKIRQPISEIILETTYEKTIKEFICKQTFVAQSQNALLRKENKPAL